ncbi:FkbM family methyltransferase [Bradyrhizobium vignae]|uniref:FkbM family methyltransferase n=1 Tax=Bradyrhizobium vignae TaxID=1549949 RepID=UPI00100B0F32|nr:FkbM family methyltransferase [Bradyrhizobium vignae]RXG91471.1 FkbM family methyltransferase [Bradyrhizobium vignae]
MLSTLREVKRLSEQVGTINALHLKAKHACARQLCRVGYQPELLPVSVPVRGLAHPLLLRPATSDYLVFKQIYVEREYAPLDDFAPPELIVDCGANVGYTSAYFLSRFPNAQVIALEPDPSNAVLCRRNLEPYGDRVQLLERAVWSHPARLTLLHFGRLGDQGECGIQVFEADSSAADFPEHVHRGPNPPVPAGEVEALDIDAVIELGGGKPIDILKLDIEKSELVIFDNAALPWLERVKNIVIELHSSEASERFFRAMEPYVYDCGTSGELTICRNIKPRAAA